MFNQAEQLELPGMPEKMPEAPPGWAWRYEATPGGTRRLVLYQEAPGTEEQASSEEPK